MEVRFFLRDSRGTLAILLLYTYTMKNLIWFSNQSDLVNKLLELLTEQFKQHKESNVTNEIGSCVLKITNEFIVILLDEYHVTNFSFQYM